MNLRQIIYRIFGRKSYTEKELSDRMISRIRSGGGKVGENVDILSSSIDMGEPYLISIGNNVTITGVKILTHDASTYKSLGASKTGQVVIGNDCFIGFGTIILPNTKIGNKVVVGAGSVVAKDIPDNVVVAGNPCKILCTYDEYMKKMSKKMQNEPCFDLLPVDLMKEEFSKEREALIRSGKGFIR